MKEVEALKSECLWLIIHDDHEFGFLHRAILYVVSIPVFILSGLLFHYANFSFFYLTLAIFGPGFVPAMVVLFVLVAWRMKKFLDSLKNDDWKGTYASNITWMVFSYLSGMLQSIIVAILRDESFGFGYDYLHWILIDIFLIADALSLGFIEMFTEVPYIANDISDTHILTLLVHLLKILLGLGAVAIVVSRIRGVHRGTEEFKGNAIALRDYLFVMYDGHEKHLKIRNLGSLPSKDNGGPIIDSVVFVKTIDSKLEENDIQAT